MSLEVNKINIFELRKSFGSFSDSKMFIDAYSKLEQLDFMQFHLFGEHFSSYLLASRQLDQYRNLVKRYNDIFENVFGDEIKSYRYAITKANFFNGMFINGFLLKDKTDIFSKREFEKEHKLKETMLETFKDWSFESQLEVSQEVRIGFGICDIYLKNVFGKNYAIELKKGIARRKDVYQTHEYTLNGSMSNGILVTAGFDDQVIEIANALGIFLYEYDLAYFIDKKTKKRAGIPEMFYLTKINFKNKTTPFDELLDDIHSCDGFYIDFHPENPSKHVDEVIKNHNDYFNLLKYSVECLKAGVSNA